VRRTEGLTIIELLVAMAILAILLGAIVQPITQTFQISGNTNRQLAATTHAQRIVERFKAANQSNFDQDCIELQGSETSDQFFRTNASNDFSVSAQVTYLDAAASTTGTPVTLSATCSGTPSTAPLKRLIVTVSQSGKQYARIIVDIPRPTS
jgi:prepilin-type N-terminal cleavage/methylation domain-containing protein